MTLVSGARQAGKSTLVRQIAGDSAAEWRDLDLPPDRQSALEDPVGFVSFDGLLVIDEIQRAPELLLAIKVAVDADPRPGRFLLTGSARLLGLRDLPDTLPGRMETIELWPFSQGEIDRTPDSFIDAAFTLGPGLRHESAMSRADYADRAREQTAPGHRHRSEGRLDGQDRGLLRAAAGSRTARRRLPRGHRPVHRHRNAAVRPQAPGIAPQRHLATVTWRSSPGTSSRAVRRAAYSAWRSVAMTRSPSAIEATTLVTGQAGVW